MGEDNKIQLFENQPIRTAWNEELEEWYFSIIDVIAVLTESKDANAYWRKLKQRLIKEGNETVTNCHALKMKAADGKRRLTDVASTEQLLRIIQSIPSKKAEPFKLWLAQVGRDRIEEIIDPELTIDRALETYAKKGYPADWINQRLTCIEYAVIANGVSLVNFMSAVIPLTIFFQSTNQPSARTIQKRL